MHRLCTIFAVFTLTVFLMGCGSTPPSRFYTLSAASGTAAGSSKLSVLVGPVAVPALVDRPQIVVDAGANQVRLDDFNRWAAPLQSAIARVVADNLVAMLGTPRVTLSSQTLSADADFRATIDVQSFQSAPGGCGNARRGLDRAPDQGRQVRDRAHHRARAGGGEKL